MADVTELIRVRRPARERLFDFQDANLSRSLSMMKLYALLFPLLVRIGTPRYFPKSVQEDMPSSFSVRSESAFFETA